MNRTFKIIIVIILLNIVQLIGEFLFMSILEKIGLSTMNIDSTGEPFGETFVGLLGYYIYSKLIFMMAYILVEIVVILFIYRSKTVNFKSIVIVNIIVSIIVMILLWFAFANSALLILNPLVALLLTGLFLLLCSLRIKILFTYS